MDKKLDTIKILTIAAMCYENNLEITENKAIKNKDIRDLLMHFKTVEGTDNKFALSRLAKSGTDVNKIEGIEDVERILFTD